MELQLMMDGGAETLHGAMWFSNTSPSYEQLSSVRSNRCDIVAAPQQTAIGYHSPQNSLWQDKNSPKNSPTGDDQIHLNGGSPQLSPSESSPNCEQNNLKRRSTEPLQHITELEKKHIRREGSIGSNGSGQGWSTQVEELAEHLADFDGSLSALAASDLATAVASYTNMRLLPRTRLKRRRADLEIRLKLATVLGIASHRGHEKLKPVDSHGPRVLVYHFSTHVRECT